MAAPQPTPVSEKLSRPAYQDLGEDQHLTPLFPEGTTPTLEAWQQLRPNLRKQWDHVLGKPSFGDYKKAPEVIETFDQPDWKGTLLRQPTGPDQRQLLLLMEPKLVKLSPRPGAVVPYYHPDPMAGFDVEKRERILERPTVQFGRHLVQQGYVVVCMEAFPYNTVPEPENSKGFDWWRAAATKILQDNPEWTGMGKLIHDTSRAVDLLLSQPDMDPDRVVCIGHSLGGKMAFYTGCLDERIKAIIASDFGIGWDFTNWKDPWYLGEQILADDFSPAPHQLLALHAPRSCLVIGGQYDKPETWQYLNAVKPVYRLFDREQAVGMFDHATGHQPTEESIRLAYRWLAEQFGLEEQPWEF